LYNIRINPDAAAGAHFLSSANLRILVFSNKQSLATGSAGYAGR